MNIIQINASYKPAYIYGGPTLSVAALCEHVVPLLTVDDKLTVLTTTANGKEELEVVTEQVTLIEGVPVRYFKRITKDHTHFSPSLFKYLKLILKNTGGKKIVHIHAWWNMVSVISCLVAKMAGVPVLLSPRGMLTSYTLKNRNSLKKLIIHNLLGKRLLNYCHIHATSEKEKTDILQIIQPKSINVLFNLVKFPEILPLTKGINNKEATFRLLFLSRIEEKKGLEFLLTALSEVSFSFVLNIGGSGTPAYIESLKKLASVLKIDENINWIGQVDNTAKFKLIAAHDLLCLTSYNENFANIVVESLSQGTPVLLSEEVGLADYVEANDFGWVTGLTSAAIKKQLEQAFMDGSKRESIKKTAPMKVKMDFNNEKLAMLYLKLYSKIAQE